MTWHGNAERGLRAVLLSVTLVLVGFVDAKAAYRLTFRNGTSVEVQAYEDLGDAIRYPRLGGVIVVPKGSIAAIEEAVHLPPPSSIPSAPSTPQSLGPRGPSEERRPSTAPAVSPITVPPLPIPSFRWQQAEGAAIDARAVRIMTGVTFVVALVAVTVFFLSNTWAVPWGAREGPGRWGPAGREDGRLGEGRGARSLGVVLVSIYNCLTGGLTICAGLTGVLAGQLFAELPVFLIPTGDVIAFSLLSLVALGYGALVMAAAYGMWSLQSWGWRLQVILCFVDILLGAHALIAKPPSVGSLFVMAGLFIDSAILLYLSRPRLHDGYANDAWDTEERERTTTKW